jgi:hypothetical protein
MMVSRKEREGVGEEEQETEPTPAYPGLEMAVQMKALDVWESKEFVVGDWMGGKVMDHSGVKTLIMVRDLWFEVGGIGGESPCGSEASQDG